MASVMTYLPPPADLPRDGPESEQHSSPWLPHATLPPYQEPYMTPAYSTYSASGEARFSATSAEEGSTGHPLSAERSPWAEAFTRPPPPEYLGSFNLPAPPLHVLPSNLHNRPLSGMGERPRSSPSTFGPSAHTIHWPDPREFRSHYPEPHISSPHFAHPGAYQPGVGSELGSPSPPPTTLHAPQPTRRYAHLAPYPDSTPGKRGREDDDAGYNSDMGRQQTPVSTGSGGKRRKRTCSVVTTELSEDDRLLVSLKEDEALPWKDIAARFGEHHGRTFQVAALQMRYKRLREKFRVWQPEDVEALKLAADYYEKYKWDIISTKMLDFGIVERWPAKHCARKWSAVGPRQSLMGTPAPDQVMLPPPGLHSPAQSPEFAYPPN